MFGAFFSDKIFLAASLYSKLEGYARNSTNKVQGKMADRSVMMMSFTDRSANQTGGKSH